jgi:hypothetical protein
MRHALCHSQQGHLHIHHFYTFTVDWSVWTEHRELRIFLNFSVMKIETSAKEYRDLNIKICQFSSIHVTQTCFFTLFIRFVDQSI